MVIKPYFMDYEDAYWWTPDCTWICCWGIYESDKTHPGDWVASFTEKEDAEMFFKLKYGSSK